MPISNEKLRSIRRKIDPEGASGTNTRQDDEEYHGVPNLANIHKGGLTGIKPEKQNKPGKLDNGITDQTATVPDNFVNNGTLAGGGPIGSSTPPSHGGNNPPNNVLGIETKPTDEIPETDSTIVENNSTKNNNQSISYYRPKWFWLHLLCCLIVIFLLAWILWCLYHDCGARTNFVKTITVYQEVNQTKSSVPIEKEKSVRNVNKADINSSEGLVDSNSTLVSDEKNTLNSLDKVDDNTTNHSSDMYGSNSIMNNSNIKSVQRPNKGTLEQSNKIERLNALFKARVLPNDTDFELKKLPAENAEIMIHEVTIKEYSYFANGNPSHFPEFWNNGTQDLRKNVNSIYKNVCLDEDCPIIGITPDNIKEYIKWINRRTIDGEYQLMSISQWKNIAKYDNIDHDVVYVKNSNGSAHTVKSKNAVDGIYDLFGNVGEIVSIGNKFGVVGGSWNSNENNLKEIKNISKTSSSNEYGFRLVKIYNKKETK